MSAYVASYFKQQLLSDCELVISWPEEVVDGSSATLDPQLHGASTAAERESHEPHRESQYGSMNTSSSVSFPAHQIVLFKSRHFAAQAQRWQKPSVASSPTAQQAPDESDRSDESSAVEKLKIGLRIDSAEQLSAAEAVIAALYVAEGCFADLQHKQLVQALIIADMLDLPEVVDQVLKFLNNKTESEEASGRQGLSATLKYLVDLSAWPDRLHQWLPLALTYTAEWPSRYQQQGVCDLEEVAAADADGIVQRIVLAVFSDLQAVWQSSALSETLMQLPLPAMQLLLGSDELRVPSEDFVLYTAQQYVRKFEQEDSILSDNIAAAVLSLVRAPFLSDFALRCASYQDTPQLTGQRNQARFVLQLRSLFTLKCSKQAPRFFSNDSSDDSSGLSGRRIVLPGMPKSWQLGRGRQTVKLQPAVVLWKLPVEQLKTVCKKAHLVGENAFIQSPGSPPMGALSWMMHVGCHVEESGVRVGLFIKPVEMVDGVVYRCEAEIRCLSSKQRYLGESGVTAQWENGRRRVKATNGYLGAFDYVLVNQPMAGGWDEDAWACSDKSASGDIVFELKVLGVY